MLTNRILAFELRANYEDPKSWSPLEVTKKLINVVVDGSVDLQTRVQGDVHIVSIQTGDIHATDFERMDEQRKTVLLEAGRDATIDFIENEVVHLRSVPSPVTVADYEEMLNYVVEHALSPLERVVIAQRDTEWAWKIFPTLLHWRMTGLPVQVLVAPSNEGDIEKRRERSRRSLLVGMGVQVYEVATLPVRGFILKATQADDTVAAIQIERETSAGPLATCYSGRVHEKAIRALLDQIVSIFPEGAIQNYIPSVRSYERLDLCQLLQREVSQYNSGNVKVRFDSVSTGDLSSLTRYARAYRYKQISRLLNLYGAKSFELFEPLVVNLKEGKDSIVTPPVIEKHGANYVVIEGNTRALFCRLNGIQRFRCVVVEGVQQPLPARPSQLKQVRVATRSLPREERMPDFNIDFFRYIESAVHRA